MEDIVKNEEKQNNSHDLEDALTPFDDDYVIRMNEIKMLEKKKED